MADTKISGLTALTGANAVSGDLLTIVDISDTTMAATGTNKSISLTQLQSAPMSAGTANGVLYLNGSKVATSGSALTFDGTTLALSPANLQMSNVYTINWKNASGVSTAVFNYYSDNNFYIDNAYGAQIFRIGASGTPSERMRLTSTGLGIGTSSPATKLHLSDSTNPTIRLQDTTYIGRYIDIAYNQNGVGEPDLVISRAVGGSPTTLATLDYSGNLGLGVTPNSWFSSRKVLQINSASTSFTGVTDGTSEIWSNAYLDAAANTKYVANGYATLQQNNYGGTGGIRWMLAPSGTAGNAISFTQAMTLDASGNLSLATTSGPAYGSKLRVQGGIESFATQFNVVSGASTQFELVNRSASAGFDFYVNSGGTLAARIDSSGNLLVGTTDTTAVKLKVQNGANPIVFLDGANSAGTVGVVGANPLAFYTNGNERARIDSSGNLLVGTTSVLLASRLSSVGGASQNGGAFQTTAAANTYTALAGSRNGNNGNVAEWWYNTSTQVGTISVTSSATAYNTSSDYRLKDNQQPLTGSGAFIDALQPKTWEWKSDGSKGVGFIAHEVQEVSPGSVVGVKDAVNEEGKPIYQAMEYGSAEFIANIIAELQSLRKRLADAGIA